MSAATCDVCGRGGSNATMRRQAWPRREGRRELVTVPVHAACARRAEDFHRNGGQVAR